jgi:hypothetical protein
MSYAFEVKVDSEVAARIASTCNTCDFVIGVTDDGVDASKLLTVMSEATEYGLTDVSAEVVGALSPVLPTGGYEVCLFSVRPRLAEPGSSNDFFRNEYVQFWGEFAVSIDLTYYRDDQIASRGYAVESDDLEMVYELIVPLQRREALDAERVEHYRKLIREGHRPTAIALGILDDRYPIHSFIAHEHLLNFLIDGHHKMEAAHLEEAEITLLSCITTYQLSSDTALKNLIDAYKEAAASQ